MFGALHDRLQVFQLVQRHPDGRDRRQQQRQQRRAVEVLRAGIEQRAHHVDRDPVVVRLRDRSRRRLEHVLRRAQVQQVNVAVLRVAVRITPETCHPYESWFT